MEKQTRYRYRDEAIETTYIFTKWADWSKFGTTPIEEKEDLQVEAKTQYRYKEKE